MIPVRTSIRSIVILFVLHTAAIAIAQSSTQPKLSTKPLRADQLAVYRAFLEDYESGSKSPLNLANVTDPFLPDTDPMSDKTGRDSCMKTFPRHISAPEVHLFPDEFASAQIRLVDPTNHKLADPGDSIRRPDDVDAAVDAGFAAALMKLSEVVFDSKHQLAAFSYSFVCGRLCGNGGTVVYELRNGRWKRSPHRCSSWVS